MVKSGRGACRFQWRVSPSHCQYTGVTYDLLVSNIGGTYDLADQLQSNHEFGHFFVVSQSREFGVNLAWRCKPTMAMDLSKAFDSVPHWLLIAKLRAYGMSKNACNMIVSYLSNQKQRVKISGEVSNWSTINRGMPQGSVLGPLLFNIF